MNKTKILKYEGELDWTEKKFLTPAKSYIPQWYKNDKRTLDITDFNTAHIKHCVPFLDAMLCGYMVTTPVDMYVKLVEEGVAIQWSDDNFKIVDSRPNTVAPTLPTPNGYAPVHFIWQIFGAVQIPDGYSAILTHPFNHNELPFYTLTAVIDDFVLYPGNIPFFIKKDFEGLIPAGTPYLQVIPFKRENWEAKEEPGILKKGLMTRTRSRSLMWGWYRRNIWKKKSFN
jgi:hypothetical protein